eukprot:CAMPEP_0115314202 /NCGR_PEP_ID=MMETSP0270-20121206/76907_1 /TAXON_ID=71861 /ORGANISM="Scrippsiella trochoidea, Strain CCMP3099" /LENGTH=31 /DNA_ID= /DNA_START= /DNA_END= /DNA_ORIENTATION=
MSVAASSTCTENAARAQSIEGGRMELLAAKP